MTKLNKNLIGWICVLAFAGCGSDGDKATAGESAPHDSTAKDESSGGPATPDAATADDAHDKADAGAKADAATTDASRPPMAAMIDYTGDIRGLCDGLNSGFPDDHACIPAPPPDQGMQIHIGPANYDDPDEIAKFIQHPGEESDECFTIATPNDHDIKYQTSTLSGRNGTHHIIDTMYAADGGDTVVATKCEGMSDMASAIGTFPGASRPYMPRLSVAPEYAHVGSTIPAHARIQADMHYYNFTDHDILREFWVNIYYAKDEDITVNASQIAGLGGFSWNKEPIQPGTDKVYQYSCPVKGDGWILMLLGHYHAHGRRETATIKRKNGDVEKVFEMYDYLDPAQFEYNSIIQNPSFSANAAGAVTGRLELHDGDSLDWECHIVNDSNVALKYVNEVKTGEMCNLWGTSIGVEPLSCYLP
jgi:hypothetical protein